MIFKETESDRENCESPCFYPTPLINLEKDAEFNLILISKSALMKNILKGAIQKMRVFGNT